MTNDDKLDLILEDLGLWVGSGDSDCSMTYAYEHGFYLHAINLWLSTGAMSEKIAKKVKNVVVDREAEAEEVNRLLLEADIFECNDCNHAAFLHDCDAVDIMCSSCSGIAKNIKLK